MGNLGKNTVGPKQLKKNSVTTAKIKNKAVTAAKIQDQTITGTQIKDGTITGTQVNPSTLGTVPVANLANSLPPPEAWHEIDQPGQPAFENSWGNVELETSTAAFYKDTLGVVHLKGVISGSVDGTAAFFLPPGFRPSLSEEFPTAGLKPEATIQIFPDGEVRPFCGQVGCGPSLDGITFRAES